MDMSQIKCLWCGVTGQVELLGTTNECNRYCGNCNQRYSSTGETLDGAYPQVSIHQEQDDFYGRSS